MCKALAEHRQKSGLTQIQVALALSITQSAISQWEQGLCQPRSETLIKLADLYGCTVDELLRHKKLPPLSNNSMAAEKNSV